MNSEIERKGSAATSKSSEGFHEVLDEMIEDERLKFARAHGYIIRPRTNLGMPDKYEVMRPLSEQERAERQQEGGRRASSTEETVFQLRVRNLHLPQEKAQLVNEVKKRMVDFYEHPLRNVVFQGLDAERAKPLLSRKQARIKKLEKLAASVVTGNISVKRSNASKKGDALMSAIYDEHVLGDTLTPETLKSLQDEFDRAAEELRVALDDMEKELIALGLVIPRTVERSPITPYR